MITYKNGQIIEDYTTPNLTAKYGLGFFETVLYNGEKLCHFELHIARLKNSLKEYGFKCPEVDCESLSMEILKLNNLIGTEARVNIYAELNSQNQTELTITAQSYKLPKDSYKLNIYNRHQESHLNTHKSMNWAHCYLALDRAIKGGYDNALLVSRKSEIFEAATASILLKQGDRFVTTPPTNRLQSIALEVISKVIKVDEQQLFIWDLDHFDNCFVLNSLIGVKPVTQVTVFTFDEDKETAQELSKYVRCEN